MPETLCPGCGTVQARRLYAALAREGDLARLRCPECRHEFQAVAREFLEGSA
jgi:hypothetical protein